MKEKLSQHEWKEVENGRGYCRTCEFGINISFFLSRDEFAQHVASLAGQHESNAPALSAESTSAAVKPNGPAAASWNAALELCAGWMDDNASVLKDVNEAEAAHYEMWAYNMREKKMPGTEAAGASLAGTEPRIDRIRKLAERWRENNPNDDECWKQVLAILDAPPVAGTEPEPRNPLLTPVIIAPLFKRISDPLYLGSYLASAKRDGKESYDTVIRQIASEAERAVGLEAEIAALREALTEISKGEGAYRLDPLEHASNTIDSMKNLALSALKTSASSGTK